MPYKKSPYVYPHEEIEDVWLNITTGSLHDLWLHECWDYPNTIRHYDDSRADLGGQVAGSVADAVTGD
jgi:hypothetical protein